MQDQQHRIEELQAEIEQLRQKIAETAQQKSGLQKKEAAPNGMTTIFSVMDSAKTAVIAIDSEGKIFRINSTAEQLLGYKSHLASGQTPNQLFRLIPQKTSGPAQTETSRTHLSNMEVNQEKQFLVTNHGLEYPVEVSFFPITSPDDQTHLNLMIVRNLMPETELQQEIEMFENAVTTFCENPVMSVILTNEKGIVEIWNPATEKITGYLKEEAIGKPFYEIFPAFAANTNIQERNELYFKNALEAGLRTGNVSTQGIREINIVSKSGQPKTIRQAVITLKTKSAYRFAAIAEDITHTKITEQKFSESEERFRILADNLPGVVYLCRNDETYSMLYLNKAVVKITGFTNDDFLENRINFVELYHPEDAERIIQTVNTALNNQEPFHLIYRLRNKDGNYCWIEEWGTGVWDGKKLLFLEGFMTDISHLKHADKALKESQDRFKRLVEHSPDIIYSFSTVRGGSYHSSRVTDILGYTPQQLKDNPKLWENSIHPDDLPSVLQALANTGHGHPINVEYRIRSASGEWRWIHDKSMHIFDNKGETLIEGVAIDITDRKVAQEKLRQSEQNYKKLQELFRNMADIIPDMLWAKDLDKKYIFVNNSVCKNLLNATDTDEPIGKGDMFFANRERESHPDNPDWHTFGEVCSDSDQIVIDSGKTVQFDEFGNVKGKFLFLDVIKTPLRNEKNEMTGVVGTARDVTENKKAELKLRESEANLKAIIENSLENIWSVNNKYEIQYINAVFARSFEQTFGVKLTEGSNVLEALPDMLRPVWKDRYDRALKGEQFDLQEKIAAGENVVYVYVSMNPIVVDSTVVGVSIFGRDITEQVLAKEKLVKAKEKAEESDRLKTAFINNISHEIRTPLNGILGFGQALAEPSLPESERYEYYKILQSSSNRLMQTVTDFIDISMLTSGTMEVNRSKVYLNALMEEMRYKTLMLCTQKDIQIIPEIPDNADEAALFTDGELLRKAIFHLLNNSTKFTTRGNIRFGYRDAGDEVTFFVTDTGIGIAADQLKNMFEVFTQGDTSITRGYEGTGLGLSITKGIVTLLGGNISVDSKINQGTTFSFTLPKPIAEKKPPVLPIPVSQKTTHGKPLILVAEDDESNFFYIKMVLEKSGYSALRTTNGADAVQLCLENPDINLVLMDIKMPVMNGIEATKSIRQFNQEIPIIAITAYAQSGDENHILSAGCTGYLSKPVRREELLQLLSRFLIKNDLSH